MERAWEYWAGEGVELVMDEKKAERGGRVGWERDSKEVMNSWGKIPLAEIGMEGGMEKNSKMGVLREKESMDSAREEREDG